MMSKLIEVQSAKEFADTFFGDPVLKMAVNAVLNNVPAVDAVEVVHGEWTIIEDDWNDETNYECSVCKEVFVTLDEEPKKDPWNFCPNCGADMRGGE